MNTREATINARLHALLCVGGDAAGWHLLLADAQHGLGTSHRITLRIEAESARVGMAAERPEVALKAWADLRARADTALAWPHPTAMMIRSRHADSLARRGEPGDLDSVVHLRHQEYEARIAAEVDPLWTGIARMELAIALIDRARFGALDPQLASPGGRDDLQNGQDLISSELDRRNNVHGPADPFTRRARAVFLGTLLVQARRCGPTEATAMREEIARACADIVTAEWRRRGRHTLLALRAQVVRAAALSGLLRHLDAEREARLAVVLSRRYPGETPARALMVLARIQAAEHRRTALVTANQALNIRLALLPANGHQVAESRQLVAELERDLDPASFELWRLFSGDITQRAERFDMDDDDPAIARADESVPA